MTIHHPCLITPRLLPGLQIGDTFISVEYAKRAGDGHRVRYRYHIDGAGKGIHSEYTSDDLQTGSHHDLQQALESLLSFLVACGESYAYSMRNNCALSETENGELFPRYVAEWAYQNMDEIEYAQMQLDVEGIIVE